MTRVGMLAPMPVELKPLVRRLGLRRTEVGGVVLHRGALGEVEIVASLTGIGPAAGERAAERLLDAAAVDHVMVVGIAGGIAPGLEIGDLVVPEVVVDGATGRQFRPSGAGSAGARGKIVTHGHLELDKGEHARLVADGVVALDMETAAVAAVCERRGCSWTAFRAISDRTSDELVDDSVMDLAGPDGKGNVPAILRFLVTRPHHIPRLVRLARDTNTATAAAADAAIAACATA